MLEQLSTVVLAVLCQRIMEDPYVDEATAEQALHLKREWIMLQVPTSPDLKEHKDNLAKLDALKHRMVQFLSGRDIL